MKKVKVLTALCTGLLLVNLLLIAYLWMRKPDMPKHEGPRNIIIEKLGLDKEQIKQYDVLIQWHRSEIRKTEKEIIKIKNVLYSDLKDEKSNRKDSLIRELALQQEKIENIHFKHFIDIRGICREDQMDNYRQLTEEIASLFAAPHLRKKK